MIGENFFVMIREWLKYFNIGEKIFKSNNNK